MKDPTRDLIQAAEKQFVEVSKENATAHQAVVKALRAWRDTPCDDTLAALRDATILYTGAETETAAARLRRDSHDTIAEAIRAVVDKDSELMNPEARRRLQEAVARVSPAAPLDSFDTPEQWAEEKLPEAVLTSRGGGVVYRQQVSVLSGQGGAGKSQLALQWIVGCSLAKANEDLGGSDDLGLPVTGGMKCHAARAAYLAYEDVKAVLYRRVANILGIEQLQPWLDAHHASRQMEVTRQMRMAIMCGKPLYASELTSEYPKPTEWWDRMWASVEQAGIEFLVIDPVRNAFRGNMNASESVGAFMEDLDAEARKRNIAILLLAHSNKTGRGKEADDASRVGGAAAWTDSARFAAHLDSKSPRKLHTLKTNHGDGRLGLLESDDKACWLGDSKDSTGQYWRGFHEVAKPVEKKDGKDDGGNDAPKPPPAPPPAPQGDPQTPDDEVAMLNEIDATEEELGF